MAIYKITELLDCLNDYQQQGLEYVDISELPAEDDMAATLNIDAIESDGSTVCDQIDAVELPDNYDYQA